MEFSLQDKSVEFSSIEQSIFVGNRRQGSIKYLFQSCKLLLLFINDHSRKLTKTKHFKMTMWADNIKFVKDIIDGKYQKIDSAANEMNENAESLLKDPACQKSKEHFLSALRVLELVQTAEIEMLLDTITGVSNKVTKDSFKKSYDLRVCIKEKNFTYFFYSLLDS